MSDSSNYYDVRQDRYEDYNLRLNIFKQNTRELSKDMERV